MNCFFISSWRNRILFRIFFLLILLLTAVSSSRAEEFLLFYGNDIRGELEPCG